MKCLYWFCSLSSKCWCWDSPTNNDHSKTQGCKAGLVEYGTEEWRGGDFFWTISNMGIVLNIWVNWCLYRNWWFITDYHSRIWSSYMEWERQIEKKVSRIITNHIHTYHQNHLIRIIPNVDLLLTANWHQSLRKIINHPHNCWINYSFQSHCQKNNTPLLPPDWGA